MPLTQIKDLVKEIPCKLRSYRGPLDLSWVRLSADQWEAAVSAQPPAVTSSAALPMLLELHAWVDGAPSKGMSAYVYPSLYDVTRVLFGSCPVHLSLLPEFRGITFHANMRYWQVFEDGTPYLWDLQKRALVSNDAFVAAEKGPPPALCVMCYPSQKQEETLLWPAAFHEIGHYLYYTLQSSCLQDPDNEWLSEFVDLSISISAYNLGASAKLFGDLDPSRIVSNWLSELFCDMFATILLGPAYALTLRSYSRPSETIEQDHPPLALRLRAMQPIVSEQLDYLPDRVREFVSESLDPGQRLPSELASPEDQLRPDEPLVKHVVDHLETWTQKCRQIIENVLTDTSCPIWHNNLPADAVKRQVNELVSMLLSYVPPVGVLKFDDLLDTKGAAHLSVEPSLPGPMFLAAASVRFCDELWKQFEEPWDGGAERDRGKSEDALNKLLIKALADSHVERKLKRGS